jgi:hypothetical protein
MLLITIGHTEICPLIFSMNPSLCGAMWLKTLLAFVLGKNGMYYCRRKKIGNIIMISSEFYRDLKTVLRPGITVMIA